MANLFQWVAGSRPRTLPMAVAPVVLGAACAAHLSMRETGNLPHLGGAAPAEAGYVAVFLVLTFLALIVSLALQVGVNYANDYSDGIRGTDNDRVGPVRLTGSQLASPQQVKTAAIVSFAVAGAAGVGVTALTGYWWFLILGAVCVLAAWWYTGGKHPYGYLGLGEVMVFVFFGLVATIGTAVILVGATALGFSAVWVAAISHGLIASALLMVNNIRDIPTDAAVGKKTLAVRLGETWARRAYQAMMILAAALPPALGVALGVSGSAWGFWLLIVVLSWPSVRNPLQLVSASRNPRTHGLALVPVLQLTSVTGLLLAGTFSAALLLAGV